MFVKTGMCRTFVFLIYGGLAYLCVTKQEKR